MYCKNESRFGSKQKCKIFCASSRKKIAPKAVVSKTEPAAPEASTQNDDDYVYIRVPIDKMAPVDNGFTETVHHQISQIAMPRN